MSRPGSDMDLPVPGGSLSFTIPDLPEDASDEEIRRAIRDLEAAKKKLLGMRKDLAEEAEEFLTSLSCAISDEEAQEACGQLERLLREAKKSITLSTGLGKV